MGKVLRIAVVVSAALLATNGYIGLAFAQPKIINVPQKKSPKPKCIEHPPRLDGEFTQVLQYEVGGLKETHTTKGKVTWVQAGQKTEGTEPYREVLPPLPMSTPAADGLARIESLLGSSRKGSLSSG